MTECPLLTTCPFFIGTMDRVPDLAEQYKSVYCKGSYQGCARFIVHDAVGKMPGDLMPNEIERVDGAIEAARQQPH